MVVINSSFIGDFKLGDNMVFNLSVLKTLYDLRSAATQNQRANLRKPIIIMNVSIIEAVLFDLHNRIKTFTREGVANISDAVMNYIRLKKTDELEKYIASAQKHDLFEAQDVDFYNELHELRKLRNRVHIQNTKRHFEADDVVAFSEERLVLSERALEFVMRAMARKYARPAYNFVANFDLPWNAYFEPV